MKSKIADRMWNKYSWFKKMKIKIKTEIYCFKLLGIKKYFKI